MLYGKLLSCKVKNAPRGCTKAHSRACLKKAFRELRVPVCGRFYPNKGGVAGYGNRMRVKYTAKWGLQIAEMIFQTRSSDFLFVTVLLKLPVCTHLPPVHDRPDIRKMHWRCRLQFPYGKPHGNPDVSAIRSGIRPP